MIRVFVYITGLLTMDWQIPNIG